MFQPTPNLECRTCRDDAQIVLDHVRGEATCRTCARVIRSNICRVDGFAYKHGGSNLRSSPVSLTSKIGTYCNDRRPTCGDGARKRLHNHVRQRKLERLQNQVMMDYHTERFPYLVNELIDEFVSRMDLSKRVQTYAKAMMSRYVTMKKQPVRKTKVLAAVFTFMGCRRLGCDRPYQDFVDTGLVRKRELGLHYKKLIRVMSVTSHGSNPPKLMKRYFHHFNMTTKERVQANNALQKIIESNRLGGRSPKSLITIALYTVLKSRPLSLSDISRKLGLACNTSNHCLSLLYKKE